MNAEFSLKSKQTGVEWIVLFPGVPDWNLLPLCAAVLIDNHEHWEECFELLIMLVPP